MEATSEDETSAAAGTSGQSSWGSTLSLMLFGPLAMSRRTNSGRRQSDGCDGIAGKNEQKLSTWSSWCFHDIQQLTEGVMPEVAKLMHEVHDASWQSRSESNELLDTDATWRFPELAPCLQAKSAFLGVLSVIWVIQDIIKRVGVSHCYCPTLPT